METPSGMSVMIPTAKSVPEMIEKSLPPRLASSASLREALKSSSRNSTEVSLPWARARTLVSAGERSVATSRLGA
eukprot:scaffold23250_cov71-Phaeocystis_antarctica.AAC.4